MFEPQCAHAPIDCPVGLELAQICLHSVREDALCTAQVLGLG